MENANPSSDSLRQFLKDCTKSRTSPRFKECALFFIVQCSDFFLFSSSSCGKLSLCWKRGGMALRVDGMEQSWCNTQIHDNFVFSVVNLRTHCSKKLVVNSRARCSKKLLVNYIVKHKYQCVFYFKWVLNIFCKWRQGSNSLHVVVHCTYEIVFSKNHYPVFLHKFVILPRNLPFLEIDHS